MSSARRCLQAGLRSSNTATNLAMPRLMLEHAVEIKRLIGSRVKLIMNDRADLCLAPEFDGVHVGQDDLSPEGVRRVIGPELLLGVSTHNAEQLGIGRSDHGGLPGDRAGI